MKYIQQLSFQYEAGTDFVKAKKAIRNVEEIHIDPETGYFNCSEHKVFIHKRKFNDSEKITTVVCEYDSPSDLITISKCYHKEHQKIGVEPATLIKSENMKPEDQEIKKELQAIKESISRIG